MYDTEVWCGSGDFPSGEDDVSVLVSGGKMSVRGRKFLNKLNILFFCN